MLHIVLHVPFFFFQHGYLKIHACGLFVFTAELCHTDSNTFQLIRLPVMRDALLYAVNVLLPLVNEETDLANSQVE